MEITEVRIKLMHEAGDRLAAFCSITFDDCFVVRDLKIIEGVSGPFVAMPSRKLTARCPGCKCKNHLRASYCNQCGLRMKDDRVARDDTGRAKLYADIAHPINAKCREMIQERIVEAYYEEIERAKQPGYVSTYDDYDLENEFAEAHDGAGHGGAGNAREPRQHTRVQPAERQPAGPHRAQRASASEQDGLAEPRPQPDLRLTHPPHSQPQASGPHGGRFADIRPAEAASEIAPLNPPPMPPPAIAADEGTPADGFGAGIL